MVAVFLFAIFFKEKIQMNQNLPSIFNSSADLSTIILSSYRLCINSPDMKNYMDSINKLNSFLDRTGIDFVGMNIIGTLDCNYYMTEENAAKFEFIVSKLAAENKIFNLEKEKPVDAKTLSIQFEEYARMSAMMQRNLL